MKSLINTTLKASAIFVALVLSGLEVNAQCTVTATATPSTLPCGGGQVQLDAVGNGGSTQVLGSDFNSGAAGPGWTVSAAGQFNNPCDASYDGGTYMWMGPTTAAPREMQTNDFDLTCGGNVCFWLDFSTQGGASPCEGPDLTTEGVYFEYSTAGAGGPWTLINYFQPNTATNAFTTWANFCYPIPAGAMTANTRFRWYQGGSSGTCCDHWGIDDVVINATNCGTMWYDWDNINPTTGPAGDPASQTVTVTSDTSFTVCYTNGAALTCCETVNITVLGMQPPTAVATDETCAGDSDGTITITEGINGTPAYIYDITGPVAQSNGTGIFTGLPPGTYTCIVTDGSGCTGSVQITIAVGANCCPLVPTIIGVDADCNVGNNPACTGNATVTPTGGFGTISYIWYDAAMTPIGQTAVTATNLCAGTYYVDVTDQTPCTIQLMIVINEPAYLDFTATTTNSTCGAANGTITITGNGGGTPNYTYDITGPVNQTNGSGNFTGLPSGAYTGTITDANGCSFSGPITVVDDGSPTVTNVAFTDPLCNGACDGTITITATGGIPPLQYSIDGGITFQASNVFNGVCDGNFSIVVEDVNTCQASSSTMLTDPPALSYTATTTDLLCFQDNTGAINVTESGGTGPYTYDIGTGPQGNGAFNSIGANTYTVTVTDNNGCTVSGMETVTEPTQLTMSFSSFDAVCSGYCDGYAITIPAGGTTPYTYAWSNNAGNTTVPTENSMCAGIYDLTITDDNGCQVDTLNYPINEPAPLLINNVVVTDELCMGDCQGTIDITSAGATTYSIDGGVTWQPTGIFNNMCSGNYTIVVADATGCTATAPTSVASQAPINLTTSSDTTICIGGSAVITATATGGVAPLTYNWDNGLPANASHTVPDTPTTYNVVVTDANGCSSVTLPITVNINPALQVTALSDASICPGESVSISSIASGGDGGPYTYNWVEVLTGNPLVGQNQTVFPTATGDYIVTADDGCETPITTDVITITVNPTPSVAFTSDVTDGCIDLPVNFSNTTPPGEVGNNCIWDFGDGSAVSTDCVAPFHMYTVPGCYDVTLTVTSPEGCVGSTTVNNYICAYDLPIADFEFGPQPTTVVNPTIQFGNMSQNGVNYYWDFGTPNADPSTSTAMNPTVDFPSTEPGTYQVCLIAESVEGCLDTICKYVIIDDEFLIYVPNAFTPDNDGVNDIFTPVLNGYDPFDYQLQIFDRWGELIFESSHPTIGWDGTVKGNAKLGKSEVYVWKINVRDNVEGEKKEYVGHVTLLK
jgi:gliding motility-associated-like protein